MSRRPETSRGSFHAHVGGTHPAVRLCIGLTLVGCATTPPASPPAAAQPKPWRPDPGSELGQSCQTSAATCREAAEKLASTWTIDEETFGALKTFNARLQRRGRSFALDGRFVRPRFVGALPQGASPVSRPAGPPIGTWRATCEISREGKVTRCAPDPSNPAVGPGVQQLVKAKLAGPYAAATLDGRPFGCLYEFFFEWWRQ